MNKKLLTLLLIAGIAVVFMATGLQAGTKADDIITMNSKVYKTHTKSPDAQKNPAKLVEFTHKKHNEEFKLECGACHHDDKGKPLALKMGDDVQKCDTCHDREKADKKDAKFKGVAEGTKNPVDIKHHKTAMHENCIGCHITTNIAAGDKTGKKGKAPTSCKNCHVPM
ncbi:MAG: cytochrome c3 family protein [Pseudomonadota bacterium]